MKATEYITNVVLTEDYKFIVYSEEVAGTTEYLML
jgi:hypothetical protein